MRQTDKESNQNYSQRVILMGREYDRVHYGYFRLAQPILFGKKLLIHIRPEDRNVFYEAYGLVDENSSASLQNLGDYITGLSGHITTFIGGKKMSTNPFPFTTLSPESFSREYPVIVTLPQGVIYTCPYLSERKKFVEELRGHTGKLNGRNGLEYHALRFNISEALNNGEDSSQQVYSHLTAHTYPSIDALQKFYPLNYVLQLIEEYAKKVGKQDLYNVRPPYGGETTREPFPVKITREGGFPIAPVLVFGTPSPRGLDVYVREGQYTTDDLLSSEVSFSGKINREPQFTGIECIDDPYRISWDDSWLWAPQLEAPDGTKYGFKADICHSY